MDKTCPHCGHHTFEEQPRFCSACGGRIDGSVIPAVSVSETRSQDQKNPQIAVFCSSFIPGLGQVYNGEPLKGFVLLLGSLFGAILFLIPGLIIWIYSMYDAHITAGKMNDGTLEFRPMQMVHMVLFVAAAVFIVIAAVVIVTIVIISSMLSLLGTYGNSDFSRMLSYYGRFF
jgi:TM2 domain-containing membrane protein YozV